MGDNYDEGVVPLVTAFCKDGGTIMTKLWRAVGLLGVLWAMGRMGGLL